MSLTVRAIKDSPLKELLKKIYNKIFPYFGCTEEVLELSRNTLVSDTYSQLITASSFIFRVISLSKYYKKIKKDRILFTFSFRDIGLMLILLLTYQFEERILDAVLRITKEEPTQIQKFFYRLTILLTMYKIKNQTLNFNLLFFSIIPLFGSTLLVVLRNYDIYQQKIIITRPLPVIYHINKNLSRLDNGIDSSLKANTKEYVQKIIAKHRKGSFPRLDYGDYKIYSLMEFIDKDKDKIYPKSIYESIDQLKNNYYQNNTSICPKSKHEYTPLDSSGRDLLFAAIIELIVEEEARRYSQTYQKIVKANLEDSSKITITLKNNKSIGLLFIVFVIVDIIFFSIYGLLYNIGNNYQMNAEYNHEIVKLFKFELADAIAILLSLFIGIILKNRTIENNEKLLETISKELSLPVNSFSIALKLINTDANNYPDEFKWGIEALKNILKYYYRPPYFYKSEQLLEGAAGHLLGLFTLILSNLLLYLELYKLEFLVLDHNQGVLSEELGLEITLISIDLFIIFSNFIQEINSILSFTSPEFSVVILVLYLVMNSIRILLLRREYFNRTLVVKKTTIEDLEASLKISPNIF